MTALGRQTGRTKYGQPGPATREFTLSDLAPPGNFASNGFMMARHHAGGKGGFVAAKVLHMLGQTLFRRQPVDQHRLHQPGWRPATAATRRLMKYAGLALRKDQRPSSQTPGQVF